MKPRILVIDDDPDIVTLVRYNLEKEGYLISAASSGEAGIEAARRGEPDLVLLDLMLPGMDGAEVCRLLRQDPKTAAIPIIMLTAKTEETDIVSGLAVGADDYVTKPFSPKVVIARVRAVLRRHQRGAGGPETVRLGQVHIDFARYRVTVKEKPVALTAKEFQLLRTLIEARGRVLTRDHLLERIWGYDRSLEIETRTVDVHIGQLRKKLGPDGHRIVTVKNIGYRCDVDEEP